MPTASTIVFAGGDPGDASFLRALDYAGCFIVAVDRGLSVAAELGLTPDLFVGDGDSVPLHLLEALDRTRTRVVMLPVHKDVSDLEAAFDTLAATGHTGPVLVLAGLGGRLDHCLFNLQLAARYMTPFQSVSFEDDQCLVRPLAGSTVLQLPLEATVSFVPETAEVEVSLAGFAYPLDHALVQRGSTRLLSNVVSSAIQHVDVHRGLVFMIAWKHQIERS